MIRLGILVFTVLLSFGRCATPAPPPEPTAVPAADPVDIDDPETCRPCHDAVVAEWSESMHSRAHHSRDPIYAGVRAIRIQREGEAVAEMCALCHTPRADDHDGPAARAGVACAACHNAAAIHGAPDPKGRAAIDYAGGTLLVGPHDVAAGAVDAHQTGAAPAHMRDATRLCLACHDAMISPAGVPICTTGPEMAKSPDADGESCASCHMPRVDGPSGVASERADHASHAFPGPHRAWYQQDAGSLAGAVALSWTLAPGELTVTLANRTGHGFPTGFPGRMALVRAIGYDAAGAEVWRNWSDDAMAESPQSVLNKVYVDADGKPTLAPYAAELERDTRLEPGETRTLSFAPPVAVTRVRVTLLMRLLPPPLAAKTKLTGALEDEPRAIAEIEIALEQAD